MVAVRAIGEQFYNDTKRKRFVVYRRIDGLTRKTSVRYGAKRTKDEARVIARQKATAIRLVSSVQELAA